MEDQQKRLFLALLMCAAVVVLWQMFFFTPPVQQPAVTEGTGAAESVATAGPQTPVQPSQADGTGAGTGQAAGPGLDTLQPEAMADVELLPPQRLEGNSFYSELSNAGGVMSGHHITAPEQYIPRGGFVGIYPGAEGQPSDFALLLQGVPLLSPTSPYELVTEESLAVDPEADSPTYTRLVYRWTDGDIQIDKIFAADPERAYVLKLDIVLTDLTGRGRLLGDLAVQVWADGSTSEKGGIFNPIANAIETACFVDDDLETESVTDAGGQRLPGNAQWSGVMDRYFLSAIAVRGEQRAEGCEFLADGHHVAGALHLGDLTLGPGESRTITLNAYVGPKASADLSAAGANLSRSVEYGIFGFLAKPMRWVLTTFHSFIPNLGIAIILLTILVKLLMFPLTHKSFKSMEGMREIQPKLTELRDKYKNDKAKLTEETMKLYREHGVNPLGCLPMFLQMPIYIALYRTIYSSVELYQADFALWVHDLSEPDPFYILPVLMTATMFGQQLLMPAATDNPQMKWVMRLMPVMFGVFMLVLPSGLVLYIFVSSLLGILQQWYIRRQRKVKTDEVEVPESTKQTRQQRRQEARRQGG